MNLKYNATILMKRMIFHIPLKIDPNLHSASQIRPMKMLQAFKDIGYDVDVVAGTAAERKKTIKEIKKNIRDGIEYDFLYSESSTMPTLLTESHHLPIHPFLDFSFFRFCKRQGIKIGLFYRDIYWVFPEYGIRIKDKITKLFYRIDLMLYNRYVDILFLPSLRMKEFIPSKMKMPISDLPSGSEIANTNIINKIDGEQLEIFYVGGIGNHYDLTMLCRCVAQVENIHLTICCRPADWGKIEDVYKPLLNTNIEIVHASGKELDYYYQRADICSLFVEPGVYRAFAMPYKLLEFIGRAKPVLTSNGTAAADFVKKNKVGFCIDYNEKSLLDFLKSITKSNLSEMKDHILKVAYQNSWTNRAIEVAGLLDN